MKNNIWLITCMQACLEILYCAPFLIIANHFLVHMELMTLFVVIVLCYLIGYALGKLAMIRFLEWVLCIAIAAIVSIMILGQGLGLESITLTIITSIAVMRGYRSRYVSWQILFPSNMYTVSIVIYFVTPAVFMFYPELKEYSSYLYWMGILCIIHVLYLFNLKQLEEAAHNKQTKRSIAMNILRANRIATTVVIGVIVIIINMDRIARWVSGWVQQFMSWIYTTFFQSEPEKMAEPALPMEGGLGGGELPEPQEASAWMEFLEKVTYYAGYVMLILVIITFVYLITTKFILPLFRKFISTAKLTRELEVGYSDEEEKLEAPQLGHWIRELMKRTQADPEPEDNNEKVRYVYRQTLKTAIKKGYEFQKSRTPIEIERSWPTLKANYRLPRRLVELYNKARYGESAITDEEINKLKSME